MNSVLEIVWDEPKFNTWGKEFEQTLNFKYKQ